MKLSEVFDTHLDLTWEYSMDEYFSQFELDGKLYGISAIEEVVGQFKTIRIDFHVKDESGINHNATNFGDNSFKVLAIVSNAVKAKFSDYDVVYFLAKKTTSDKEFDSRVKLYSRIVDKLKVEQNRFPVKHDIGEAYLFALCSSQEAKDALLNFV